jgi:DNA polymerase III delta prime subunit
MTKNAQQALKYLLQSSAENVRFCLICNYISKIDESLKNEFISIRFNQLPKKEIEGFLKNIASNEGIVLSDIAIDTIQKVYQSDIRSMINFIQLHQNMVKWENTIITDSICLKIFELLCCKSIEYSVFSKYMYNTSIQYNTDKRNILKYYLNYIVRKKAEYVTTTFLNTAEFIVHVSSDADLESILQFAFYHLHS